MVELKYVAALLLSVLLFGCINTQGPAVTGNNSGENLTTVNNMSVIRQGVFTLSDLEGVLLSEQDVPRGFEINALQTGVTENALQFSEGDAERANELKSYGWKGNKAVQYDYKTNNLTSKAITVLASVYEQPTQYFSCNVKWDKEDLGATSIEDVGQQAVYLGGFNQTPLGMESRNEIRSFFSNVAFTVKVNGLGRSASKQEAFQYAKLISDRLKGKCPTCVLAPTQCGLTKPSLITKTQNLVVIQQNSVSTSYGGLSVIGSVKNNGTTSVTFVQVTVNFFDSQNQMVTVQNTFLTPSSLRPSETGSFNIAIPDKSVASRIARYEVKVTSQ